MSRTFYKLKQKRNIFIGKWTTFAIYLKEECAYVNIFSYLFEEKENAF